MKLITSVILLAGFFLFFPKLTLAQQCAPTRIINQYACVTQRGSCQVQPTYICSFSGTACPVNVEGTPCGPTQGNCIQVCSSYAETNTCNVISDTVACSAAPSCEWQGSIKQCTSSASQGTCTETTSPLTYSCWINSSGGGGGGGGGGTGYGACGSCSGCPGGNNSQCRTDPSGACVWDPSGCGAGGGGGPVCAGHWLGCWIDSDCCDGRTCNGTTSTTPGNCYDCTEPEVAAARCGPTYSYCGFKTYLCAGSAYPCPPSTIDSVPGVPTGLAPATGANITPALTCNDTCSATTAQIGDVQCGANTVEGRLNTNNDYLTHTYIDIDAIVQNGVTLDNTVITANGFFEGYQGYFRNWSASSAIAGAYNSTLWWGGYDTQYNQSTYMLFTTVQPSLQLRVTEAWNRGLLDIFANGILQTTYNLHTVNPTINWNQAKDVTFASAKSFICSSGACRLKSNPSDATCGGNTEKSIVLSWTAPSIVVHNYEIEVYPAGTDCTNGNAVCRRINRSTKYRLLPATGVAQYSWRVRAVNDFCSDKAGWMYGPWSPLQTFSVVQPTTTITSTVTDDPSLTGGTAPTTVGTPGNFYCTSPSTGGTTYVSGGSIQASNSTSGTTYPGSIAGNGDYSIPGVVQTTGDDLCVTFTPSSSSVTCTCPVGCTYCGKDAPPDPQELRFYLSPIGGAWYQTVGGDVAAFGTGNSVVNRIPTFCVAPTCSPYLTTPYTNGDNTTAGSLVITNGATIDLSETAGSQSGGSAPPGAEHVIPSSSQVCRENYAYFYRLYSLGLSPSDDFSANAGNATKPSSAPSGGKDAYYHNGNMTIGTAWTLSGSEEIVVFVNGNLTINANITMPSGTFVAFIVSGNITVGSGVGTATFSSASNGQVQGVYIADGTFTVASAGASGTELKFVGEGVFAACNGISLPRNFANGGNGLQNNSYPASLFIARPDIITNTPDKLKVSPTTWREVAP